MTRFGLARRLALLVCLACAKRASAEGTVWSELAQLGSGTSGYGNAVSISNDTIVVLDSVANKVDVWERTAAASWSRREPHRRHVLRARQRQRASLRGAGVGAAPSTGGRDSADGGASAAGTCSDEGASCAGATPESTSAACGCQLARRSAGGSSWLLTLLTLGASRWRRRSPKNG